MHENNAQKCVTIVANETRKILCENHAPIFTVYIHLAIYSTRNINTTISTCSYNKVPTSNNLATSSRNGSKITSIE